MDKQKFFLNPDHVVSIEETPDTVITLFNDHHFIVQDSAQAIINKIIAFKARIIRRAGKPAGGHYRSRPRRDLFRSATLNKEEVCPVKLEKHQITPLHSQDL